MRDSLNDVATKLRCPITQELPFDPVMAEDGRIYERKAILQWFSSKRNPTSPSTGARMGLRLLPAIQTKNTIETLIKSGAIEGELAEAWQMKLQDETYLQELRAEAEEGDGCAMCSLGRAYSNGLYGLVKSKAQSRAWYKRSAATHDPAGMACFGGRLLKGSGGPMDKSLGFVNVTAAAYCGSDYGAYLLGKAFSEGVYGLSKDPVQARFWLKKVVAGECEVKDLNHHAIARAVTWLQELEAQE